jgi:phenylpyruvate tautomerase PptA (4-oxalocrotonate tautomerase family)
LGTVKVPRTGDGRQVKKAIASTVADALVTHSNKGGH